MLIVLAKARIPDGAVEQAREAMSRMILESRKEDGCIDYAYALDILEPNTLRVIEKWDDEAALAYHFGTEHMAAFQQAVAHIGIEIVELAKFQADEGRPLR